MGVNRINVNKTDSNYTHSIFDISEYTGRSYASLSDALGDVPQEKQKGGMTVCFVIASDNSDNKYVQYRLMADEFTTDITQWSIADEGVYVENPEFIYVETDAAGKILWAIKIDGSIYYGAGVPQQVIDYIEEKIAELSLDEYEDIVAFLTDYLGSGTTLKTLLDSKLDAEGLDPETLGTVQAVENPEWLSVTIDSKGKILGGRKQDGTVVENCNVEYPNGIPNGINDLILQLIKGSKVLHNPYQNIDFSNCKKVLSNTHEHIYEQERLEWCYNKGIRNINLLHYKPAAPQKFEDGYSVDFQDYTSINDLTIITKHSGDYLPTSPYHDFIDKDGNEVHLSDIVVLPNCEHTNIRGYNYWVHSNFLGSEFAEPADLDMPGGVYGDRANYKILNDEQLFEGVTTHRPFGKTFGTLNHPADSRTNLDDEERFVARSCGLINAVEVFNGDYGGVDAEINRNCEAFYDRLLKKGYELWCVAVPDWANIGYSMDLGMNMLLLPSNYDSLIYVEKQNAILDAYIAGHFFAVGVGGLSITNILQDDDNITFVFNKNAAEIYGIFDGNSKLIGTNVSQVTVNPLYASKYFRLKAIDSNGDFIYSNPMFIK